MNLFKSFRLTWWQAAAFKVSLLSIGLIIGAWWSDALMPYLGDLLFVATVATAYITYVWIKQ